MVCFTPAIIKFPKGAQLLRETIEVINIIISSSSSEVIHPSNPTAVHSACLSKSLQMMDADIDATISDTEMAAITQDGRPVWTKDTPCPVQQCGQETFKSYKNYMDHYVKLHQEKTLGLLLLLI